MSFNLEELGFKAGDKAYYVVEAIVVDKDGSLEPDWVQYSEEWLTQEEWERAKPKP